MDIIKNKEIDSYIDECKNNISINNQIQNEINEYSGVPGGLKNIADDEILLFKIQKLGYKEDSFLMDEKELTENEYYKNISFKEIKSHPFYYKKDVMPPKTLLNMSWLIENERCMDDSYVYGYFNKSVDIPVLIEKMEKGHKLWMSPTIAEQRTMKEALDKATGNILTFGLGIGYYPYMTSLKDNVTSITIIERDKRVIEMFKEFILPQFDLECRNKIKIIEGNAFDYFNKDFIDKFDYTFVDIWEDNEAGLDLMEKLLEQYNPKDNVDYWIENTLTYPIRLLILIYIDTKINGSITDMINSFDGENYRWMKKIHKYMRNLDMTVDTKEQLKTLIYDKNIIREILSNK